ncbi:D-threo-aldose 1-dehydrogenase [Paramicrobacterium humi]|uniref:D-threo-aldose 1-dehydrogenase n=1 Tax=Paramicrobacterium humi TaxID=640635 RepID=A0A1H4LXX8_9MICO|nr:aldo/keto reductase [Microbacterium humi]SEB75563.1 D-threo-aldose 1-dehydrogenase [Microbacterium humi]
MSELELPRIGYGAANVGNLYRALSDEQAWEILQAAWDAGVRYFDTAPHYGLGLSEKRLGAFLQSKPRDQFTVSTKVGRLLRPNPDFAGELDEANDFAVPADLRREFDFSAAGIRASVEESLERTGLDRFDVLYLHDPERADVPQPLEERLDSALTAMAELRDTGSVRAIGVGSMTTNALLESAQSGQVDLLMVAGRYTLAEQPALAEVIPACRERGVGIVNASVFNSGLLAKDAPSADARYEYGGVPADVLERVTAIAGVCRDFDVPLPAAALQYTLREPVVRSVVVGASRAAQMRQNVERMNLAIPEEFWIELATRELIPA